VLSGPDGSGKSTQLDLLKKDLEAAGKKVYAFHAVQFSIVNRIARTIQPSRRTEPGKTKSVTKASWISVQIRKAALLVDLFFFNVLRKMLAKENYDYIISDRYFYDTVVNIIFLSRSRFSLLLPLIERLIPAPDTSIFLSVPTEKIMQRSEAPEQGIEYVEKKAQIFTEKISLWNYQTVNADQSPENVFGEIKEAINP